MSVPGSNPATYEITVNTLQQYSVAYPTSEFNIGDFDTKTSIDVEVYADFGADESEVLYYSMYCKNGDLTNIAHTP